MVKNSNGLGRFPGENTPATIRALLATDRIYADVAQQTGEYGATISKTVLGRWVAQGHRDLKVGLRQRALARCATMYDEIREEHCTAEANRSREFDRAMQILERTCECGNEKMTMPDGTLGDTCRACHEIEEGGRARRIPKG